MNLVEECTNDYENCNSNKYQYDINAPAVEQEFRTHEEWKKETKLMATPTILINGYELPDVYKIEDLIFFKDLRIEM